MAHDVFISYSTSDKTVADAVCATLENRKIRCWIAPRDALPGVPYAEALINALNQSRIVVLVFSTSANDSPQVMREVERAVNKGIPIIPFRIENIKPSKSMEYFLSAPHWLDALTPPLEAHLQRLADTVQTLLAQLAKPGAEKIELLKFRTSPEAISSSKLRPIYIIAGIIVIVLVALGAVYLTRAFNRSDTAGVGSISGKVQDQSTGGGLSDASNGGIYLNEGWHKLVYQHVETSGDQAARAAFKSPDDSEWRKLSTAELNLMTGLGQSAEAGLKLVTRRYTGTRSPLNNHEQLVAALDINSSTEAGWYGSSVVSSIDQDENIHGSDDDYSSDYEGYFYVATPGVWQFSIDSDDSSEIVIDENIVAWWYYAHPVTGRWENKFNISVWRYDTRELIAQTSGNADGSYTVANLYAGSYMVTVASPGYVNQWYSIASDANAARRVEVQAGRNTANVNFLLNKR
jgi:hypothetical protein